MWALHGTRFPQAVSSAPAQSPPQAAASCSSVVLSGGLQGNLCPGIQSTSSPLSSTSVFSGLFLTVPSARLSPWQHFYFLTHTCTELLHVQLTGSAMSCSGSITASCVWRRAAPGLSSQRPPLQPPPSCQHLGTYAYYTSLNVSLVLWLYDSKRRKPGEKQWEEAGLSIYLAVAPEP